jgi:hypothetical protein
MNNRIDSTGSRQTAKAPVDQVSAGALQFKVTGVLTVFEIGFSLILILSFSKTPLIPR